MSRRGIAALLASAAVLAVLGSAGCAAAPRETGQPGGGEVSGKMAAGSARLSDGDSGRTADLSVGGTLVVDLEENATTGYSWVVDGGVPDVLATGSDEQKAAEQTGVVGAAGRHVFEYSAAKAGEGELRLVYVRPWEKGVAPAKTFTLRIVVK